MARQFFETSGPQSHFFTAADLRLLYPKNSPSKFLLKTKSRDLVEGVQSNKSIGYIEKFYLNCIQSEVIFQKSSKSRYNGKKVQFSKFNYKYLKK